VVVVVAVVSKFLKTGNFGFKMLNLVFVFSAMMTKKVGVAGLNLRNIFGYILIGNLHWSNYELIALAHRYMGARYRH
jgi:hypothetical protein